MVSAMPVTRIALAAPTTRVLCLARGVLRVGGIKARFNLDSQEVFNFSAIIRPHPKSGRKKTAGRRWVMGPASFPAGV
jgi:hypothetical protein